MLKRFLAFSLLCSVAACGGLGLGLDTRSVQNAFDSGKAQLEQRAAAGEITWVQAATQTRELDKYWAGRTDLDTTWKYDRDDEEYHAYCIALAESLDRNKISFFQFDAARIQRFNAIQARRQSLNAQQAQQPSNISTEQCRYNPAAQAYQVCHHVTAGGQCAHFGAPCN